MTFEVDTTSESVSSFLCTLSFPYAHTKSINCAFPLVIYSLGASRDFGIQMHHACFFNKKWAGSIDLFIAGVLLLINRKKWLIGSVWWVSHFMCLISYVTQHFHWQTFYFNWMQNNRNPGIIQVYFLAVAFILYVGLSTPPWKHEVQP